MNYSMQGMTKTIPELFMMLKSTKVEITKNIKCWWLNKITSFKKKGKGEARELQEEWQAGCHFREEAQS